MGRLLSVTPPTCAPTTTPLATCDGRDANRDERGGRRDERSAEDDRLALERHAELRARSVRDLVGEREQRTRRTAAVVDERERMLRRDADGAAPRALREARPLDEPT